MYVAGQFRPKLLGVYMFVEYRIVGDETKSETMYNVLVEWNIACLEIIVLGGRKQSKAARIKAKQRKVMQREAKQINAKQRKAKQGNATQTQSKAKQSK